MKDASLVWAFLIIWMLIGIHILWFHFDSRLDRLEQHIIIEEVQTP